MSQRIRERVGWAVWCSLGLVCGLALASTVAAQVPVGSLAPPKERRSPSASAAIDAVRGLASRKEPARKALLEAYGGNEKTEKAVAAALDWIARHQMSDGSWSLDQYTKVCMETPCTGAGMMKSDSGATALALLPLVGAGQTHKHKGPYQKAVHRGLYWLLRSQKANGDLRGGASMYSHGLATIALCEVYGLTGDRAVAQGAQRAVEFIVSAQHPETGGWRYEPGQEGDTSVLGWQLAALWSAQAAKLKVDQKTLDGAKRFLQSCAHGKGTYSYRPDVGATPSMTAVGLLCAQYLGAARDDRTLAEGQAYLMRNPPGSGYRNVYYWFHATQALRNLGGKEWDTWDRKVQDVLLESQVTEGCAAGSWDPAKPTGDAWAGPGGRLMVTSLSCLTLEVYYRYPPLYPVKR